MARLGIAAAALLSMALAQPPEATRKLEAARRLRQQDPKAAVSAYESALAELGSGAERRITGQTLLEGAQAALAAERYDRAAAWASEAADIFHGLHDAAGAAQSDHVAGSAKLYRGEYGPALQHFERALESDRQRGDAPGEITRLSNIGSIHFFQGAYLDALDAYEQALRRVDANPSAAWHDRRRKLILTNLAVLYEQLGQNEKALSYYQQVRSIGSAVEPREQGQVLANLGTLYRRMGDAVKALEMYEAAGKLFAQDHFADAEAHVLQNVGIAQALDFHQLDKAADAFGRALRLAEAMSNRREMALAHLFRAETLYRMGRLDDAAADYSAALEGARAIGAPEEEWGALYGLGRIQARAGKQAQALDTFRRAIAVIESVRSGIGAGLRAEFLGDKRKVYDAAIALMLENPATDAAALLPLFEQARSRNLQDALKDAPKPTIDGIRKRLPPGAILIDYWTAEGRVAALWITREGAGVVRPSAQDDVAEASRALVAAARDARDSSWRAAAERAGRMLLDNVPIPADATLAFVVPDGVLQTVPFELLPRGPGRQLLVETTAVAYLPSATLLLRPREDRKRAWPWRRQVAGFGNPTVGEGGRLPEDERWQALPESGRETRSIAHVLPGGSRVLLGAEDLKRRLAEEARRGTPILHVSSHAVVDFVDPDRSRILFSAEPGRRGSEYLFRKEAQALPLGGADLVTLSACDTEAGKMTEGEGVQSFSRAFLAAGARSTVTTLWRVADGPTADFMQSFYQALARGDSKAQALRAAKLAFLRSGDRAALPQYWAAFVLNGEGDAPIPPVVSWWWIAGPAAAAALVILSCLRRTGAGPRSEARSAQAR